MSYTFMSIWSIFLGKRAKYRSSHPKVFLEKGKIVSGYGTK